MGDAEWEMQNTFAKQLHTHKWWIWPIQRSTQNGHSSHPITILLHYRHWLKKRQKTQIKQSIHDSWHGQFRAAVFRLVIKRCGTYLCDCLVWEHKEKMGWIPVIFYPVLSVLFSSSPSWITSSSSGFSMSHILIQWNCPAPHHHFVFLVTLFFYP